MPNTIVVCAGKCRREMVEALKFWRTLKCRFKRKEKSTLAKRPRALREGSLTSKLERVSPKGPQT
eukprot:1060312-Pelagomonas_calceolata.AAC.1